jgi:hypothetical protein
MGTLGVSEMRGYADEAEFFHGVKYQDKEELR